MKMPLSLVGPGTQQFWNRCIVPFESIEAGKGSTQVMPYRKSLASVDRILERVQATRLVLARRITPPAESMAISGTKGTRPITWTQPRRLLPL